MLSFLFYFLQNLSIIDIRCVLSPDCNSLPKEPSQVESKSVIQVETSRNQVDNATKLKYQRRQSELVVRKHSKDQTQETQNSKNGKQESWSLHKGCSRFILL